MLAESEGVPWDLGAGGAPRAHAARAASHGARVGSGERTELGSGAPEDVAAALTANYRSNAKGQRSDNLIAVPIAGTLKAHSSGCDDNDARAGHLVAHALTAREGKGPFDPNQITHPENRSRCRPGDPAPCLINNGSAPHVAYSVAPESGQGRDVRATEIEVAPALTARAGMRNARGPCVVVPDASAPRGWRVRRLTPRECERLQGLPDDWTLIPRASDTKRYEAVGNGVAVPVIEWIGRRLERFLFLESQEKR